jgi:hypothetical protein
MVERNGTFLVGGFDGCDLLAAADASTWTKACNDDKNRAKFRIMIPGPEESGINYWGINDDTSYSPSSEIWRGVQNNIQTGKPYWQKVEPVGEVTGRHIINDIVEFNNTYVAIGIGYSIYSDRPPAAAVWRAAPAGEASEGPTDVTEGETPEEPPVATDFLYVCVRLDDTAVECGRLTALEIRPPEQIFTPLSSGAADVCGVKKIDGSIICWQTTTGHPP